VIRLQTQRRAIPTRSRAVSTETASTVWYSCPQCRAQLEARLDFWDGWMRCPVCGRASLPPEPVASPDAGQRFAASNSDGPAPGAGVSGDNPLNLDAPEPAITFRSSHTSPARLIFTTGFVLSLVLALISFLDVKTVPTAIFGFLAIVFFLMLLRTPRKRVAPWSSWRSPSAAAPGADHEDA
jgi:hypothetical protein